MIRYEYECGNCGKSCEFSQSIHEKPRRKCPACGKMSLERLISGGCHAYCEGEVTTLGQLAEKNSKKQGKEITARRSEGVIAQREARQEQADLHRIAKMSKEQQTRYIMDGD